MAMQKARIYSAKFIYGLVLLGSTTILWLFTLVPRTVVASPGASRRASFQPTPPLHGRGVKIQGDYVAVWRKSTSNIHKDQIQVFNRSGNQVLSLNPLKSVQGAERVSVWDVSLSPRGTVGVAAVFVKSEGTPAASLVVYDSSGALARAFSLEPDREIRKLQIDEEESIWTLGAWSGGRDPAYVPMIVKYDREGNQTGKFLPRSEFPLDAEGFEEGPGAAGNVSFGLAGDKVWLWLPGGRELVTMRRDGSEIEVFKTDLPQWPGPDLPSGVVETRLIESNFYWPGRFLAQVNFLTESSGLTGLYEWNTTTKQWKPIPEPDLSLSSGCLFGAGEDEMALKFLRPETSTFDLEWVPLPPSNRD